MRKFYDCYIGSCPTSEEQLKAFLEKVQSDTILQEKLKTAADANTVAAIAKEASFSISADDISKAQSEVSEEELESVAGGGYLVNLIWDTVYCNRAN